MTDVRVSHRREGFTFQMSEMIEGFTLLSQTLMSGRVRHKGDSQM